MDVDHGGLTRITQNPFPGHLDKEPGYSPRGSQIVFVRERSLVDAGDPRNTSALFVVNADGSGLRRLTRWYPSQIGTPSWSPDGGTIVFRKGSPGADPPSQIFAIGADGQHERPLTTDQEWSSFWPSWSPDGRLIVFTRVPVGGGEQALYTMAPDGNHIRLLEGAGAGSNEADWAIRP